MSIPERAAATPGTSGAAQATTSGPSAATHAVAPGAPATPVSPRLPQDEALHEARIAGEQVWQGRLLDVRRDRVRLPSGGEATREYIAHPGAVMVVPLLDDDHAVMIEQYRYPVGGVLLEFPAGKIDAGEQPFDAAQREMREETGYRARRWARLGSIHVACAYSNEAIELWLASGLVLGESATDEGETVRPQVRSLAQVDALAARGGLSDAKTLAGLWWWQRWRQGLARHLEWQEVSIGPDAD